MPTHPISSAIRVPSRSRLASLVFAVALFAIAACGGSSGGDAGPTSPSPAPGGGGGGGSTQATLTVTNQTASDTASFVRTRACGGGAWSDDLLGGADYLETGETVSANLAPGCYDVRITPKDLETVTFLYFYGVQLTAGQTEALTITAFPAK